MNEAEPCAVYARYSSLYHQREASIEDQIRKCYEFADAEGYQILKDHIYFDKAKSGDSIAPREGFKALIKEAMNEGCKFKRIIVDDTSRVARNTREALDIFSLLSFYGIHVSYVSQGIDTADETAEEMITIHGLIDSLYIRNLAKETHRGIVGQVLKGFSGGGRRYGYRSEPVYNGKVDIYGVPEADGYKLKRHAEEADTIIRIYKFFGEQGYSARKIVNILNKEIIATGKPKPPKGKFWAITSLLGSAKHGRGILNNPIYCGRYYWNRSKTVKNPKTGKDKHLYKDKEKWILVFHPELQIIDDELWQKVKDRRRVINELTNGVYNKGKIFYSSNLFSGLLKCAHCGGNIVIVNGGKFAKYGCSNNWNKGSVVCGVDEKIKKEDLEEVIIKALDLNLNRNPIVSYLVNKANFLIKEKLTDPGPKWRENAIEDQLKQVERDTKNYISAIQFGIISETVKCKLADAENKRDELMRKLQACKNSRSPKIPKISVEQIHHHIKHLRETLYTNPLPGKEFFRKIISRINIEFSGNSWKASVESLKEGVLSGKTIETGISNTDIGRLRRRSVIGR